jgi:hypothetical protein
LVADIDRRILKRQMRHKMAVKSTKTRKTTPLPKEARPRFVAVANRRLGAIVKALHSMHSIGNQRGDADGKYSYTDEDVKKIIDLLDKEIEALESKLNTKPKAKAAKDEIALF